MGMNTTTAPAVKPAEGAYVTAIRDIVRGEGTAFEIRVEQGTELLVTDTMSRSGYDRPGRIGVRVNGGLAIGVVVGEDVKVHA